MKSIILSSIIALVALITVGTLTSFSSNSVAAKKFFPQWNEGPCLTSTGISGKITGIGNGDLTIVCTGQVACDNPADNAPPAWQDFTSSTTLRAPKNGNLPVDITLSLCKRKWTQTDLASVTVTVFQGGVQVIGSTTATSCN